MPKQSKLQAIRDQIAALDEEIRRVRAIPVPLEQALVGVRRQINASRARFEEKLNDAARAIAGARSGRVELQTDLHDGRDAFAGLAFFMGEKILAELERRATTFRSLDEAECVPADQREALIRSLQAQRYDLELSEESEVEATGAARRPDVTVAAVLGVPYDIALEKEMA